jgi:hypothetical protein
METEKRRLKMQSRTTKYSKLTTLMFISLISLMLTLTACDNRTTSYYDDDHNPPPVPSGLTSITGDEVIWLEWDPIIGIGDLDGYNIYRSMDNYTFFHIATVNWNDVDYTDDEVINGQTYYYGISAFDYDGNESEISFEYSTVFDTPRPEGFDEIIYDFHNPNHVLHSGFDLSQEEQLPFDHYNTDFFLEFDNNPGIYAYYIWLGDNGAAIQDMGYTESFDEITFAPYEGWSQFPYVEAIEGHTYVLRTEEGNYSKIRITQLNPGMPRYMVFDWGYQIDTGNRELSIGTPGQVIVRETVQ